MLSFIGGIMFTVGSLAFGKGMYELGRIKQRSENRKELKKVCKEMNCNLNDIKNMMKKGS